MDARGNAVFKEVKNGAFAKLNTNQKINFEELINIGGVPVGNNASTLPLPYKQGMPTGPINIEVIHY